MTKQVCVYDGEKWKIKIKMAFNTFLMISQPWVGISKNQS
jgi:hypothetical protein